MKNILFIFLGVALLSMTSCYKIDNYKAPDGTIEGTFINLLTNEPLQTSGGEWSIRIWERSYPGREGGAANNNYQTLAVKQDGSYRNTKLFKGTYDMLPYNGPFWEVDTVKDVVIGKRTRQDFEVYPYLQILDFRYVNTPGTDSVRFFMRVKAPFLVNPYDNETVIPQLYDVRFFISFTQFVGNGTNANIGWGEWHNLEYNGQKNIRRPFADVVKDEGGNGSDTTPEYMLGPILLRRGYTYNVRGGANVNYGDRRYIYSEILKIDFEN